jgi:hypothetical protein
MSSNTALGSTYTATLDAKKLEGDHLGRNSRARGRAAGLPVPRVRETGTSVQGPWESKMPRSEFWVLAVDAGS